MRCLNSHRRPGRAPALLTVLFAVATAGASFVASTPPAWGQGLALPTEKAPDVPPPGGPTTEIVPSIEISERYDSNVFFIGQGKNLEDYVTTVVPRLQVNHNDEWVAGNIYGSVTGEAYVKNPGLNYFAPAGGFLANLNRTLDHFLPQAKLRLRDDFVFTPRPPAFAAPEVGNVAPASFVRGIQSSRANSFSNVAEAKGSYSLRSNTDILASYTHQMIRFGNAFVAPPFGRYFDTTFQIFTAGPEVQVSSTDILSIQYQWQKGSFDGGGFGGGFSTQGGFAEWRRSLTPNLTMDLTGGLTVISEGNSLQYIGSASLDWVHENTTAKASYSRTVVPSFFIGGLPLLSEMASASMRHKFTEKLAMFSGLDWADNRAVPDPILTMKSQSVRAGLDYTLTDWATLTTYYTYGQFKYIFFGQVADFDRHQLWLTLRLVWK